MILDLKMPRKSGYDVLQWLRDQSFRNLSVFVVSGSFLPDDVTKCMKLGVNNYYKKTSIKEEYALMIHDIEDYLKSIAE